VKTCPGPDQDRSQRAHAMRRYERPGFRVALAIASLPGMTIHFVAYFVSGGIAAPTMYSARRVHAC